MDDAERELQMMDELEHAVKQRQVRLLMKLNKRELRVLADHYQIKGLEIYFDDGWMYGGKEELCNEIADHMLD